MRKRLNLFVYICFFVFFLFSIKCRKDELVKVTKLETGSVTDITYTTATGSATFTDLSGNVTEFGHCWNTSGNPTTSDTKSIVGGAAKKGDFSSNLTGLSAGTRYYVKAYAIDGGKPVYGNQEEFTTKSLELPVLTTKEITAISYVTASSGGEISTDGGSSITNRGVCWSTSENPTVTSYSGKTNDGTGTGTFNSNLTGLTNNTIYYVRAYATNTEGTAYGNQQNFTTDAYSLPTVSTESVSDVTHNSAVSGGNVTNDGGSTVTARGVCWGTSENPTLETNLGITTDGNGTGTFVSALTGLAPDNDYHVRAYATNVAGTSYGANVTFTSLEEPAINITSPSNMSDWQMGSSQAIIWTDNIDENINIELFKDGIYKEDISTDVLSKGTFDWTVPTDLVAGFDYSIKVTSVNNDIHDFSDEFKISNETGTVTDYENNTYKTVKIGNQWWMAENLRVRFYSDGQAVPRVIEDVNWANLGDLSDDKGYCSYNNNTTLGETYGYLYTWAAANNGTTSSSSNPSGRQGICPNGWHLPSDAEWTQLMEYVGGSSFGGGKLKAIGTIDGGNGLWESPNTGANNETGFNALPSGIRLFNTGVFSSMGYTARWWSSTANGNNLETAWFYGVDHYNEYFIRSASYYKSTGFSVRCVKN